MISGTLTPLLSLGDSVFITNRAEIGVLLLLVPVWMLYIGLDLWSLIRTGHYENKLSTWVKYGAVVALTAYLLVGIRDPWSLRDHGIVMLAFLLTLIGDTFFTLRNRFMPGMACFAGVHLLYIYRHFTEFPLTTQDGGVRLALWVILFSGFYLTALRHRFTQIKMWLPVVVYVLILSVSVTSSFFTGLPTPTGYAIRSSIHIGMICFYLTDLAVGAQMVTEGLTREIIGLTVWVLYLPALAFLVRSVLG